MPIEMLFQGSTVQFLHGQAINQETNEVTPALQMRVTDAQSGITVTLNWVGQPEIDSVIGQLKPSAKIDIMQAMPDHLKGKP